MLSSKDTAVSRRMPLYTAHLTGSLSLRYLFDDGCSTPPSQKEGFLSLYAAPARRSVHRVGASQSHSKQCHLQIISS